MSSTNEMIRSHPEELRGVDPDVLAECIDACGTCALTCTACADDCEQACERLLAQLSPRSPHNVS
ncbi:hypothetical protein C5C31_13310 [Rathayibacter rathayi]|uniref:Four-helix bundle copper-binding protein n=1 Tax=Rathayibacter rathayi TaxID=33887 RepID=A0ABX5AE07_RATRA|nr:hypothetical protein [Rathayibacter rathayi]AZZ49808.1 hypothetical protein C1O28_11950 [Rathayibacter rathayi]MWV75883.1 hypothetical protein [Rathayibacter rathayi NCPPB 2980 = VKM Ac-1601]PPF42822.1 hypothetical protein C5C08_14595 [Rathayibacter rathayi]PPF75355.1 hypothetical protein C5C14_14240 [Rathayibacter rathayi]PPG10133.1 hypothetical protein C5C11_14530 [Rathayibacter rathayi]